jgi:heat shock protein HslJ
MFRHMTMVAVLWGFLSACSASNADLAPSFDQSWQLTSMNGQAITTPTLTLEWNEQQIAGDGFCNQYFASIVRRTATDVEFGTVASTRKLCGEGNVMEQERTYFEQLAQMRTYEVVDDTLTLASADGQVQLVYTAIKTP